MRLDAALSDLIAFVEERVGRENVVFFLTADHGVSPVPDLQKTYKIQAEAMNTVRQKQELDAYLIKTFPL